MPPKLSKAQRAVLERLAGGDTLVISRNRTSESGYDAHTSYASVRIMTVKALIARRWIRGKRPGVLTIGAYTITDAGRDALAQATAVITGDER